MGYHRKEFDRENLNTEDEQTFKKKKRKKRVEKLQKQDLTDIQN